MATNKQGQMVDMISGAEEVFAARLLDLDERLERWLGDGDEVARELAEVLGAPAVCLQLGGRVSVYGQAEGPFVDSAVCADGMRVGLLRCWSFVRCSPDVVLETGGAPESGDVGDHLAECARVVAEYVGNALANKAHRARQLAERQHLLELLAVGKLACLVLDHVGNVVFACPRAERMLCRIERKPVRHCPLDELALPLPVRRAVRATLDGQEARQGYCWEHEICWRYRASPLEAGHAACVLVVRDASRDRRIDWYAARTRFALSAREEEVARLIAAGEDQALGQRLRVTEATARTHTRNLYRKLGVHSRAQARARLCELR